ncbi:MULTISPECIES: hypothetical protein [Cysteiniphilum]|nr:MULTISPECIES: hypothetical protein [Cysteiniphilum]
MMIKWLNFSPILTYNVILEFLEQGQTKFGHTQNNAMLLSNGWIANE